MDPNLEILQIITVYLIRLCHRHSDWERVFTASYLGAYTSYLLLVTTNY